MSTRLRWKKDAKETGLRAIGAGPRRSVLHDGLTQYASVAALGGGWQGPLRGWYFVALEGDHINTCNDPAPDEATAKAQAMAHVKAMLAERGK